jgi:YspA, cpYpsA-related SLOG family
MLDQNESHLSRVLVCGSRDWTDQALIARVLPDYGPAVIVHGAARGADRLAGRVARACGWPVEEHPADWKRDGKSAGYKRNLAMLATHPALVIAFTTIAGGTPGTRHTLTNAYRRGIRVVIVTPAGAIADHTAPPA